MIANIPGKYRNMPRDDWKRARDSRLGEVLVRGKEGLWERRDEEKRPRTSFVIPSGARFYLIDVDPPKLVRAKITLFFDHSFGTNIYGFVLLRTRRGRRLSVHHSQLHM